jgi:hypothetical protein
MWRHDVQPRLSRAGGKFNVTHAPPARRRCFLFLSRGDGVEIQPLFAGFLTREGAFRRQRHGVGHALWAVPAQRIASGFRQSAAGAASAVRSPLPMPDAPKSRARPSASWHPVTEPPERYDYVYLLFADGRVRRGTWNGKLWWGYDERARRSCALRPTGWRPAEERRGSG